jgi:hypothetical protein
MAEKVTSICTDKSLQCVACKRFVKNKESWNLGLDTPITKNDKRGSQDSGKFVCPYCQTIQNSTIADNLFELRWDCVEPEGLYTVSGVFCVPMYIIQEVVGSSCPNEMGFMPGGFIFNSEPLKSQMYECFGDAAYNLYPNDRKGSKNGK